MNINSFVPGVISASGDQGTSQSILNPKAFENLSFGDLLTLKTTFGRAALAIMQNFGPSAFGIS